MAVWLERFPIISSQSTCQLTAPPLLSLPLLLSLRNVVVLGALSTVMVVSSDEEKGSVLIRKNKRCSFVPTPTPWTVSRGTS